MAAASARSLLRSSASLLRAAPTRSSSIGARPSIRRALAAPPRLLKLPIEESFCLDSLLPLHSATAAARLKSSGAWARRRVAPAGYANKNFSNYYKGMIGAISIQGVALRGYTLLHSTNNRIPNTSPGPPTPVSARSEYGCRQRQIAAPLFCFSSPFCTGEIIFPRRTTFHPSRVGCAPSPPQVAHRGELLPGFAAAVAQRHGRCAVEVDASGAGPRRRVAAAGCN